jgi:UDP-N-acetylmuramoyl-tripeptide--D-alanyl-D-alanine ligase
MRFRASDVARATGGRLVGPDSAIDGVSFDTRTLQPGQLFVPLVAERDGHDFVSAALEAGAAAYLTSRPAQGGSAIEVPDTLRALMQLAAHRRGGFTGPLVGVTGSVGKTSTKDLARAAIGATRRVWANERSFNNDQGLPTTILNAPDDTEVMVLEMGMRGFGEIARLCDIARPTIGVVTRVAEAHSDLVGGIEGVARAKAELVQALPADGVAVLNADDSRVLRMASLTDADVVLYGESEQAHVRAVDIELDHLARASFRAVTRWAEVPVRLGVSGRHMVSNALAALACTEVVGGSLYAAAEALADAGLSAMRMEVRRTAAGATVLDDSYNANPTSMKAALDALAAMPAVRRRAVLGLMAEIADPADEHRRVLEYATRLGIEVIAYGTDLYGIEPVADPVAALGSLTADEAVLVKGSRVMGLERVAAALLR